MNKSTDLPPDLQQTVIAAQQAQQQNPDKESFIVTHVDGLGWRLISAKTGRSYTQNEYYAEFGIYPQLPHPENYFSDEAVAERQKRKRKRPKGFGKR